MGFRPSHPDPTTLSECWTKNTKMWSNYAENVEDELATLEAREVVVSHLRFLDMAVYNNVFNPIGTEGTSGATKELIRSYYEDPINEWRASVAALEQLIRLGTNQRPEMTTSSVNANEIR